MTEHMTADTPSPFMEGRFSLFHTDEGGIHLCYRADGTDTDEHVPLPPILVQLAQNGMETGKLPSPMDLMRLFRAGKR